MLIKAPLARKDKVTPTVIQLKRDLVDGLKSTDSDETFLFGFLVFGSGLPPGPLTEGVVV